MDWTAFSAFADTLAAAGIIGSLMFVALQISRERRATQTEATHRRQAGAREMMLAVATSPYPAPIIAKTVAEENLRPSEAHLVERHNLEAEEAIRLDLLRPAGTADLCYGANAVIRARAQQHGANLFEPPSGTHGRVVGCGKSPLL